MKVQIEEIENNKKIIDKIRNSLLYIQDDRLYTWTVQFSPVQAEQTELNLNKKLKTKPTNIHVNKF